ILSVALLSFIGFAFPVFAQEVATSTPEDTANNTATSTLQEEIVADTTQAQQEPTLEEPTATTTPETENPAISGEASDESQDNPISLELVPTDSISNDQEESQIDNQQSTAPPSPPQPQVQPVVPFISEGGRAFDPATAPSIVKIHVVIPDGNPPSFPVYVTFVGVGRKNFGGKIDANGDLSVIMPTGRYYTELTVISTEYVQGEDGPSFFLEANEERDVGVIKVIPKSEQTSQSLEDATLEANILKEAESAKGVGKILLLIVKLLIKILEEIRSISARI
ncbi:MAG: hypothetical protein HY445_00055, partial [Candidatus Niyogibacteria bacterium]|nr:hypothetical protein [Candidatus Niyogibacteria bacterium]